MTNLLEVFPSIFENRRQCGARRSSLVGIFTLVVFLEIVKKFAGNFQEFPRDATPDG
jgi:hypothetical protein